MHGLALTAQAGILIETYLLTIQSNKILSGNYYLQIFLKIIFDLEISHEHLPEYLSHIYIISTIYIKAFVWGR